MCKGQTQGGSGLCARIKYLLGGHELARSLVSHDNLLANSIENVLFNVTNGRLSP